MDRLEIETAVSELADKDFCEETFFYDLITAYDASQTTVEKIKGAGSTGKSDVEGALIWKPKIHYAFRAEQPLRETIAELSSSKKNKSQKVRFLVATDGAEVAIRDLETGEPHHFPINEFGDHADILLPAAGIQPYRVPEEKVVDFKATKQLGKLNDALVKENPDWGTEERSHEMNQLMTRIIFCLFAEDTGIFPEHIFTRILTDYGGENGERVSELLRQMFAIMNATGAERNTFPKHLQDLPYVNGELFAGSHEVPHFSKAAWRRLEEAANLDWKEINPDIFGSMIQVIASPEKRHELGMHYTS